MQDHDPLSGNKYSKTPPDQSGSKAMAGGFFVGLAVLIGFFVGAFNGQTSAGALIGLAVGIIIAIMIWLYDVKKQQK